MLGFIKLIYMDALSIFEVVGLFLESFTKVEVDIYNGKCNRKFLCHFL